jgi:hypothetical protein
MYIQNGVLLFTEKMGLVALLLWALLFQKWFVKRADVVYNLILYIIRMLYSYTFTP